MQLFSEHRGRSGVPIVFLHGLGASGRYWHPVADRVERSPVADRVERTGRRLYLVDLLGFGRSPWPKVAYTMDDHLNALDDWRAAAGPAGDPLVLVGHSVGALIALGWAVRTPAVVGAMLAGFPLYSNLAEARRRLAGLSLLHRLIVDYPSYARAACAVMCLTRPLWRLLAPWLAPQLPAEVARDGVLHNWRSLSGTLRRCVFDVGLDRLIPQIVTLPTLFVHGVDDQTAPVESVRNLGRRLPRAHLIEVPDAGHDLPLSHPDQLAEAVCTFFRRLDGS